MLQALRNGTKSNLMRAFLLVLVVGFGMWGIGDIFRSSPNDEDAITVDNITVSANEVAITFDRARRFYYPGLNNNEAIATGLMDQIIAELIERSLFEAEAARLGLTVTRDMAKQSLRTNPLFQDASGNFNPLLMRDILARRGISEDQLIADIGYAEKRNQVIAAIASGAEYSPVLADSMAKWLAQQRQIHFAAIAISPDQVTDPDQATLSGWYRDNQDIFDAPTMRSVTAVILSPDHYLQNIVVSQTELENAFEERKSAFSVPERRDFLQMVLPDLETAEAVRQRLIAGEDFAAVALEVSGDKPEDITFVGVTRDDLPEDLAATIFAGSEGNVTNPSQTPFGVYVFEITAINEAKIPSFEDVRTRLEEELKIEMAVNQVYDSITIFEEAQDSGATLEEAAKAAKAQLITIAGMSQNSLNESSDPINDIATSTGFRSAVWQQEIGTEGMLIADEDNTYFALRVENETAARSRDLDEVKDEAIKAWKLETAISRAKTQAEDIIAANDFDAAVKSAGATLEQSSPFLQSGIGLDHEESSLIASASFSIEVGDKTLVETGSDSIIVIRLDDIIAGDEDTVTLRKNQLLADFKDHLVADTEDAIVKGLATLHDVEANPNAVVRLLIGSIN
ncbi:MAG: SurA N-terminal domain-containing protein [Proteobacteria bacterium]|jgi:peptidyl-prolyl cis-trans isomerase D|nr:SurA N-terminal domain-containing protein [Pseudomonadota bacterium]